MEFSGAGSIVAEDLATQTGGDTMPDQVAAPAPEPVKAPPPVDIPVIPEGAPTASTPEPGAGERFKAGWTAATVETDMWGYTSGVEAGLRNEIIALLDPEDWAKFHTAMQYPRMSPDEQTKWVVQLANRYLMKAGPDGGPVPGLPYSVEDFGSEVDRRRLGEWQSAQETLEIDGPGVSGMAGGFARYMVDPVNLATLPFGAGAGVSLGRAMLIEGALNAGIEGIEAPMEAQVADELGLPEGPSVGARMAMGFVGGAGLTGVLGGAERMARYYLLDRNLKRDRRLSTGDPDAGEIGVEEARARMAGGADPSTPAAATVAVQPSAPVAAADMGMIGGVKAGGGYWQGLDSSGRDHTREGDIPGGGINHKDYSQLFREYTFEAKPGYVPVGDRNGRAVYAAPDYLRDDAGNYVSVSAADAARLAAERGTLVPLRSEVKALYGRAQHVTMPNSGDFGKPGGQGTPAEYSALARERMAGIPEGTPVVHGKEFYTDKIPAARAPAEFAPVANYIVYENQGATRSQPLSANLHNALSFLGEMGIEARVFSGGQPGIGSGGKRTGSVRHDHGNAADVTFWRNGRMLDWRNPEDVPVFQEIVRRGRAAGLTGFGAGPGYMSPGSMHIGFGTPAFWGRDKSSATAPAWLREAYNDTSALPAIGSAEHPALALVREFEGYRSSPYWDVNHWRLGYGSDTITKPDGTVVEVTQGMVVDRADAERDLARRVNEEFMPAAKNAIGAEAWDGLTPAQQGVLTSLTYNYGTGAWGGSLAGVKAAVRGGDQATAAEAIRALGSHNSGINRNRRNREAAIFAGEQAPPQSRPYMPGSASTAETYTPWRTSRGYTGAGQVLVGDDMRIDVEYQVVDLDDLVAASGDLQPRDRGRAASDDWIAATAARLDPALLMASPTADRGAPLIGPDNVIESGNGRVAAIRSAYDQGSDRVIAYRRQIEDAGYTIGEGIRRPVLVARRRTELTPEARRQMVIDAQDSGVARMTAAERAAISRRALTADTLAQMDPGAKLTAPANRDFARSFSGYFPKGERGAFIAPDKGLSSDGVRQIQDALFARAWEAPDIVARALEEQPGGLKGLFDALAAAAPDMALLKAEIDAGAVRAEMDISPFVMEAVRLIVTARDLAQAGQGKAAQILEDMLADEDLLEGAWSPLTAALVGKFAHQGRPAKSKDIADFLSRYAQEARKAGRTGDALGGAGPLEVLKAIDPKTFGKLDTLGRPREALAVEREAQIDAPPPGTFEEGAASPEIVAANDAYEADLRAVDRGRAEAGVTRLADMGAVDAALLLRDMQAAQGFGSITEIMERGATNHEALTGEIRRAAEVSGAIQKVAPLKTREGVTRKLVEKYDGDLNRIADVARGGINVSSPAEAEAFIEALAQRWRVIDEGWGETEVGYFDRKLTVVFDDGQIGEVQIWPPGMLEAKETRGGHDLYEEWRLKETPEPRKAELKKQMAALYGEVRAGLSEDWRRAVGGQDSAGTLPPKSDTRSVNSASETSGERSSRSTAAGSTDPQELSDLRMLMEPSEASRAGYSPSTKKNLMEVPPDQNMGPLQREVNTPRSAAGEGQTAQTVSEDRTGGADETTMFRQELTARGADLDDVAFRAEDGTEWTIRDVLDDLDADRELEEVLDICVKGAA